MFILTSCSNENFELTDNGLLVRIKSGQSKLVKAEVFNEDIIRIQSFYGDDLVEKNSLVVLDNASHKCTWNAVDSGSFVLLKTSNVICKIVYSTGEVSFETPDGEKKLEEKKGGGKTFVNNERVADLLSVRQEFESPVDEALYGLGQHQNNQMNYKGQDVDLSQYNIVAVVPFLVSNKNYGILWDNYSRSKFGDIREYQSLKRLKLYNEKDEPGGLTVSYFDKKNLSKPVFITQDNQIQYENLEELENIPQDFKLENGFVRWSGMIESDVAGMHKFLLYSAGYLKMWIDGELVVDSWRQCWNPWTRKLNIDLKPGVRKSIKIEWDSDGGESYLSLKFLSPLDNEQQNRISFYSEGAKNIDYYFVNGNSADDVIRGYRHLTGKAPIMPKWAMGFWQSRERYKTQDQLLDVVEEYRKRKIPLDNIVIDWHYWEEDQWGSHKFDFERFPDPQGMINKLHNELNTHVMISVWAKYYEGTDNYKIMDNNGWLYKRNIDMKRKDWVGSGYISTFYDTFNENARKEFWRQINKELFSIGIDAWWMDATEPDIHSNVSWEEKKKLMDPTALGSSEEFFNAYSLMQAKGVYEGQRQVNPNQRVFILTRSAFAGQQRYAAATWSGDVVSRWFDFNAQISAGLNFCISGIPYWTTDIGGFAVEKRYEKQDPGHLDEWRELNTRWFQYGTFCPLFRSHGQLPFREIFNLAPDNSEYYQSMVYYNKLRYSLMPYIYSLSGATYFDDYTIMRPLVMDYSSDSKVLNIDDQFMFGNALLVAPVTVFKARSRKVYLPLSKGWYDFYTCKFFEGGQTINADAPVSRMPLFVKEGAIIPVGPEIQYACEKNSGALKVYVYQGADGSFTLYEDENVNYNYENGSYCKIVFSYDEEKQMLTIGDRVGNYDGMIEERDFEVIWIDKNAQNVSPKAVVVHYNGNMVQVTK
ncbi:MAG: DUF5110 domain-containing protein [Marinilabiliaceae bacterium]|nr:DUF5110 domain-containing protein [Marinilabiliaceae bacterium]